MTFYLFIVEPLIAKINSKAYRLNTLLDKHQDFSFDTLFLTTPFNLHILPFMLLTFYGFLPFWHSTVVHNTFKIDAAETLGLIKGLTDIVQKQVDSMKSTDTQIQQLASTVENLAKTQPTPSKPTIDNSGLRLPNLVLPEFTGKEPLDRFLDHLQNLLVSSSVPRQ